MTAIYPMIAVLWLLVPALVVEGQQAPPVRGQGPLTLEEVLKQVDAYYPKLRGADAERQSFAAKRLSKQGAFDTAVSFSTDYLAYNSSGTLKTGTTNDIVVEVPTRYGPKFFAGARLNLGSVKAPDSSTGSFGEYLLGVKLPLLRGLGINEKAAQEQQALLGERVADQIFAGTRLEVLFKAATVYWKWVAAGRKVDLARDLLKVAEVRAEGIREEFRQGATAGIVVAEAEQEVARREGSLAKAERDFQEAGFALSLFLWGPDGARRPQPTANRVPELISEPKVFTPEQIAEGKRIALERRPELKALRLNREITQVDERLARNDRLPTVDIVFNPGADIGRGAVGGTLKAGLVFAMPLQLREATGRINEARLKIEKINQEERLTREAILVEVDDAVSAVNAAYQRYLAAEKELEQARRVEQGERDQLAAGLSTLFLVNQRERATFEAAIRVIEAQVEYEQAVALYRAVTGQL